MVFLGFVKPYADQSLNKVGIFDEYVTILVVDSLLISSDPSLDVESRQTVGWVLIAILGLTILVG